MFALRLTVLALACSACSGIEVESLETRPGAVRNLRTFTWKDPERRERPGDAGASHAEVRAVLTRGLRAAGFEPASGSPDFYATARLDRHHVMGKQAHTALSGAHYGMSQGFSGDYRQLPGGSPGLASKIEVAILNVEFLDGSGRTLWTGHAEGQTSFQADVEERLDWMTAALDDLLDELPR